MANIPPPTASEEFSLQEGEYVLIPCTLHRGVESKYNVVVYSEKEIAFEPITDVPVMLTTKVHITGATVLSPMAD
jgi:hypothetical protein